MYLRDMLELFMTTTLANRSDERTDIDKDFSDGDVLLVIMGNQQHQ